MKHNFSYLSSCPICTNKQFSPFHKIDWMDESFSWSKCNYCCIIFMNPVPSFESYKIFYKQYFWEILSTAKKDMKDDKNIDLNDKGLQDYQKHTEKIMFQKRYLKMKKFFGDQLNQKKRVLEVGCSYGTNLKAIKEEYSSEVFGIEPSDFIKDSIKRDNIGINIIASYMEEMYSKDDYNNFFDFIIFSHSLENIVDQNKTLISAKKMLKPNGKIYIDMCNLYWHNYTLNPFHPFAYTDTSLNNLLKLNDLNIVKSDFDKKPYNSLPMNFIFNFFKKRNPYITVLVEPKSDKKSIIYEKNIEIKYKNAQRIISYKDNLAGMLKKFE